MTYEDLRSTASTIRPGDIEAAQRFVIKLNLALEADLSKNERNNIYKLRDRWVRYASGDDLRWNSIGVKRGRALGQKAPKRYKTLTAAGAPDDDELDVMDDPLLQEVIKQFGNVRREE